MKQAKWEYGVREDGSKWISMKGQDRHHFQCDIDSDMPEKDLNLACSAPDLLLALQAQEVASDMQKQLAIPSPDDPRYTPYIGPWDGYRAPEVRFMDFHLKRKLLRRTAIAKALGKGEEKEV